MEAPMITLTPPENFQYETGKPITLPVTSLDFKSLIPKDLSERDYMKKIDGIESLFKSFDNAQTALGKKATYAAPAADAPQEEWDKFLAAMRPGTADEYGFEIDPNIPKELQAPAEYQAKVKQMFHAAGLTKRQGGILQKAWDMLQLENYKAEKAKQEEVDKKFNELMAQSFGDKTEEKMNRAKAVLGYILPKEMHAGLEKMPNEALQFMAVFANAMADKYMKEDEIPKGSGSAGKSVQELRATAQAKMTEMSKLDAMDPKKAELGKEIDELYKQIAAMSK